MKARVKQRGYALLILIALLTTAAATVTVNALTNNGNNQIARDKITAAALAQARDALIGRAASDANRPGSLPCPDTNNDGVAELFVGNDCPNYIGRLPWKTLDLPDLRDGAGEHLWYVLSSSFRDDNTAQPINSDTVGNRQVYTPNTPYDQAGVLMTNTAVALVISPGDVLAAQNRGSANVNDATQYLESLNCPINCRNNAVPAGPFIAGPIKDVNNNMILNDQLALISHDNLMPVVEKAVGKRIAIMLNAHLSNYWGTSLYPFAATFSNPSSSRYTPSFGNTNGLLPITAVWNSNPDYAISGGSATVSCDLNEGNNFLNNARARCSISDISGTPSITITGTLNYLGLWRKYDLSNADEVRIRRSGVYYPATDPALAGMNPTINYTVNANSSVTVTFTGNLLSGVTRIELRDVVVDTNNDWFTKNNWQQLTYYAVSPGYAPGGGNSCTPLPGSPSCLTVYGRSGGNNKRVAIVMVGEPLAGHTHPSSNISDYLEGENATPSDFIYENGARSSTFNDQVFVVAP